MNRLTALPGAGKLPDSMTRARLTGFFVLALAAAALSFPLSAAASLEWSVVENTMPGLCGESEEARETAHTKHDCVVIAESACEATPATSEQANLHTEGCEIVQEAAAAHKGSAPVSESAEGGSGSSDTGLIVGLAAGAVVLASAALAFFVRRRRGAVTRDANL
jgi:hypothetical protein